MRRFTFAALPVAALLAAALVAGCSDAPTSPSRNVSPESPTIAFATASSEDGLSITTDKDDYQPGDTVWFTGAGWQAGDTLDIVLVDEPLTHPPHEWWVPVDVTGGFRDSTYVVDEGDLGVAFTLTATSRATGRGLTVMFTDGNITTATTPTTHAPGGTACAAAAKSTFTLGETVCASSTITVQTPPAPATANFRYQWVGPAPATTFVEVAKSGVNGSVQTDQFTPSAAGTYTVRVCNPTGNCATGALLASATFTVTAGAAATSTALSSSQNPSAAGESVTFTATVTTVSPVAAVTAGTVTFREGTCAAGTILSGPTAVNGSGQATFSTSALAIGPHTIRGCYNGTAAFAASEGAVTQQVNNTATDIDLTSSANPSVTGRPVTFTATITNNSVAVTTGQLSFKTGGTACSDATEAQAAQNLNGSGQVTYSTSFAASSSPITVRACYGGSTTPPLAASEASLPQTVNKAGTTTAVGSSVNPSVFSQAVTFTVTVSVVSPGVGTPAGNVTLVDGTCAAGTALGGPTAPNGSGQASFSVSTLSAGSHTITGCYAGNGDFTESDGSVSQTVNKAATTAALTSLPNPSVFSQTVTFEVTVTSNAPAVATPVGNAVLKNGTCAGSTLDGPTALNGSGKASFEVSSLSVATHTVVACYLGNGNFEPSDDDVSQVVNKAPTSTVLSSNHNPSVFSQTVTFSVTVSPVSPAVATPQGNVELFDGTCAAGTSIGGPSAVNGSGEASFSLSTLSVGSHTITACYAGNASFESSDGSVSQGVDKAATTTAITSSVNPSVLAQPVIFTATVSPVSPAVATPQGNLTLRDGTCAAGTTIGGPTALDGSGQASFTVSTLSAGNHTITACYAGNASFEPSDNALTQQVRFSFIGLAAPVDKPNTMNVSKAGQAIPLKWRLVDFFGNPVTTLTLVTVKVSDQSCSLGVTSDQIEEYASGQSGLQNLGDGYYQFNWKTPGNYASSCKTVGLDLGEGFVRTNLAYFTFKK